MCIGDPISWLALETHALGRRDAAVTAHLDACSACRECLQQIERDVVALPRLAVPVRRPWWHFAVPAFGALAAVAALLVLLRPRDPEGVTHIKGLGEVQIEVVRERAGTIRDDVRSFAPGDRWKVVVTCPFDHSVSLDVIVREEGATRADHPLAPMRAICGNRIVIPGAFTVTGDKTNRVCVHVMPGDGDACLTLHPER